MDAIVQDVKQNMESAIDFLAREFRGIRTGRASAGLVEHVKVDYYGNPTDLRQLASISVPEGNMLIIKPFDPSSLKDIEKAILAANIGLTPSVEGKIIRLSVPPLSGDRRKQLSGQAREMAEAARISLRNVRRDGNKEADKQEKASELSEDDCRKCKDKIQDMIREYENNVNKMLEDKVKEIEET